MLVQQQRGLGDGSAASTQGGVQMRGHLSVPEAPRRANGPNSAWLVSRPRGSVEGAASPGKRKCCFSVFRN